MKWKPTVKVNDTGINVKHFKRTYPRANARLVERARVEYRHYTGPAIMALPSLKGRKITPIAIRTYNDLGRKAEKEYKSLCEGFPGEAHRIWAALQAKRSQAERALTLRLEPTRTNYITRTP